MFLSKITTKCGIWTQSYVLLLGRVNAEAAALGWAWQEGARLLYQAFWEQCCISERSCLTTGNYLLQTDHVAHQGKDGRVHLQVH